ncbi:alanine dehydrogenase [Herbiconiux daphne]|uniref:Alanine dehydrogenase n=1 Tax=Herbiconiux daphne TaxID=2970914 RepID=A0ABT2H8X2_9MICO|nr:alanine dehydrogenase [Herbiconiux daphne]MCS5736352.1 alanine dehydrogenase [Herbiconiux daphne]
MIIGVPKEIKNNEFRVAMTPSGVFELVKHGHSVLVQQGAGLGAAIGDAEYEAAGASVVDLDAVWSADMIVKVKEPIEPEYTRMREGQLIFTYLHLAAAEPLVEALLTSKATSIAYETVQLADGTLPLLAPMSEVAGRLSVMVGSYHLMGSQGGRGVLLGGVPGVRPAKVTIIGAGMAGENALAQALAAGADVTVLDLSIPRLRHIDEVFGGRAKTVVSNAYEIERSVLEADLVIGAVLVPGAKAPKLVSHDLVSRMKPGSVLVDIAIDQGGCFEDSRPTTHDDPTYVVEGSIFYCVANMPGSVSSTSTYALTNATLPYVVQLADLGWRDAIARNAALVPAVSTVDGHLTHAGTAEAFPRFGFTEVAALVEPTPVGA